MRKISVIVAFLLVCVFVLPGHADNQPVTQDRITSTNDDSTQAIEVIGHLGGSFGVPVFDGDIAYLAVGHSIGALDISDLANISALENTGYLPISSNSEICLGGNTITAFNDNMLYLVDIQDPTTPSQVGEYTFSNHIWSTASSGPYVYIASNNQLHVMDISDPAAPTLEFSLAVPTTFEVMRISGNHIITLGAGNLYVIDIANPLAPQLADSLTTLEDAWDLAVSGNRAYVQTSDLGIAIVGVSENGQASLLGTHTFEFTGWGFITDLAANGNLVFVTAYSSGLRVLDTTNPANATEVGSIDTGWFAWNVASKSNSVFVVDTANTMTVYNVSPSGTPTHVGTYNPMGYTYAVDVSGDYAYLYDNGDGMRVVNVSDPTHPVETTLYPFFNYSEGIPVDVKADSRYVYVADSQNLRKIDVLDPGNPVSVGQTSDSGEHLALYGSYGYVADRERELKIFNLSGSPTQIGAYTSSGTILDVNVSGNHAYLLEEPDCDSTPCSGSYKLQVLGLGTPTNPQALGSYTFLYPDDGENRFEDFDVSGNFAYIAEGCTWEDLGGYWVCQGGGLHIIDISNPNSPVLLRSTPLGNATSIGAIAADGTYIYLTANNKLEVWDVFNPQSPGLLARLPDMGASHIVFENSLVYLNDDGLTILQPNFQSQFFVAPAGGSVSSEVDNTQYQFPALTFSEAVTFTHNLRLETNFPMPPNLIGIGHAFENGAVNSGGLAVNPSAAYTVTISYTQDEIGSADENTLALYFWDGTQWQIAPGSLPGSGIKSTPDSTTSSITATPDTFGFWAVLGETNRLFLPLVNR